MARCHRPRVVSEVSRSIYLQISVLLVCDSGRCDAKPDNLDAKGARLRSQIKTKFLINSWDSGILWTDFGVRADIVVSVLVNVSLLRPERTSTAIHVRFPAG